MIWWFLILAISTGVVLWAGIAMYVRVQRHLKTDSESKETLPAVDRKNETTNT